MWNVYEPEVSCEIERGHQSGQQKLRLTSPNSKTGSSSASNYEIDFATMIQTQIQSGFQRPVHRSIVPPSSLLHQGFVWEFEGDQPGEWKTYDLQTIEFIENVSANPQNGSILDMRKTFFKLPYIIDPKNGTQTRIDTGTVRRIQRRPLTQKYTSAAASSVLVAGPSSTAANPGASSSGVPMKSSLQQNKKRAHPYSKAAPSSRATSQGSLNNGYNASTLPNTFATAQAQLQQMTQTTPGPLTRRQLQKNTSTSGAQQQQHQQTPLQQQQQLHQHPYPQVYPSPYTVSYLPPHQAMAASLGLLPGPRAGYAGIHSQQPQQVPHPTSSSTLSSTNVTPATEPLPSVKKITIPKNNKKAKPKTGIEVLAKYMDSITQHLDTDDCCICFEKLSEASSYGEGTADAHEAVKLSRCSHHFHKLCLLEMYKCSHKGDSLQCPSCNTIYGEKNGDCPPGFMQWRIVENSSLPGYEGYDTIHVIYHIKPGVQGPEHASPGKPYNARGFPRQGFLPDCDKGRKILKLFIEAFRRRLMFTIGTSTTTGEHDTVTWNEIHHKTEPHGNYTGHGYPDPNYLDNVLLELASHGVTE